MESIINARQVGMIATRIEKRDTPKHEENPIEGSLQKELNRSLAEIGLQEISPWNWQHEVLREKEEPMTIDLNEEGKRWKKNKDKVNHRLREAWRWKEWTKAGQKETKVGKLIGKVPYHQDLYKRAKKWIQIPERKCLLAAGFTSPAELQLNRNATQNGQRHVCGVVKNQEEHCTCCGNARADRTEDQHDRSVNYKHDWGGRQKEQIKRQIR